MIESFFALLSNLEATFNPNNPNGLLILFFLAVVTDIGVPVPFVLDSVLLLTAYQTGPFSGPVLLIVLMLFFGRQAGSAILYLLSRLLGKVFVNWVKCHFPSMGARLDSFRDRLWRWTPLAIATGRLTPGLLQITSVVAGTIRIRYYHFAMGIAFASLIYDGLLILLSFIARHGPKSTDINFTIWLLIAMVIIVCLLWPLIFLLVQRGNKKAADRVKSHSCDQN
jgi:membrane protein DedA with SNARE-associated domain